MLGALISPTDPIAVIGILKTLGAPKDLETKIAGEALFNDGVGIVVFLGLLGVLGGRERSSISGFASCRRRSGASLGFALGWAAYAMIKSVDDYQVEILLSLGLVMGGYSLAQRRHVSRPLATVVAGLLIGTYGRSFAMSDQTRAHLDTFWELVDELMNVVLFVLIGLEVLLITLTLPRLAAALMPRAVREGS